MSELENNATVEETTEEKKLVKQILIDALETITDSDTNKPYPIHLQGSLLPNEPYPESFFTFWNNGSESDEFYSNKEGQIIHYFDLNFYSSKLAGDIEDIFTSAIAALKDAGFIVSGNGFDVPSDESSHTGRGVDLIYIEQI